MNKQEKSEYNRLYYLAHRDALLKSGKVRARQWYRNNIERAKKTSQAWSKAHPERRHQIMKRFYDRNDHCELVQQWRKNNPEKARANARKYVIHRRARVRGARGNFSYAGWLLKCEFYGWRCFYCPKILNESNVTVDHRIPLSRGGTNWLSNLVPACKSCNCRKGAKVGVPSQGL